MCTLRSCNPSQQHGTQIAAWPPWRCCSNRPAAAKPSAARSRYSTPTDNSPGFFPTPERCPDFDSSEHGTERTETASTNFEHSRGIPCYPLRPIRKRLGARAAYHSHLRPYLLVPLPSSLPLSLAPFRLFYPPARWEAGGGKSQSQTPAVLT